jgi:hypothetical protein
MRLVRPDAVVVGKTERATSFLRIADVMNLPCPARAARFAAPRPSMTTTIALRAGGSARDADDELREAIASGTRAVRLRA